MTKTAFILGSLAMLTVASVWLNVMFYTGKLIRPEWNQDLVSAAQMASGKK